MIDAFPAMLLGLQALLTVLGIELLRRGVLPRLAQLESPALISDVWAPVALVLPMLFFVSRVSDSVEGAGWMIVGGPSICGLLAVGAALIVFQFQPEPDRPTSTWLWMCIASAGLLLLLLGLAHDLTIWMGQCAFAAGAVVLWMNTPELPPGRETRSPQVDQNAAAAGLGMILALGCALAQGAISLFVPDDLANASGGMMIAGAAAIIASSARVAGSTAALRIGGWASVYGITLGLGVMSMMAMIPQALHILREEPVNRVIRVANGFGLYALEAALLIGVAAATAALSLLSDRSSRLVRAAGVALVVLAALLSGWRLAKG